MLTLERFRLLEARLRALGYDDMIAWAETVQPPPGPDKLAEEIAWVICGAGMNVRVAAQIFHACMRQVRKGKSACKVFRHKGKCAAIDFCWRNRALLHAEYLAADDKLAWCAGLPWIGPVTKYHLGKNLGLDVPKPDVHLDRLARAEDILPFELCERLAEQSGFRIATVDTILWRACADGILDSALYRSDGWDAAYRPGPNG